ncbi:MAG TPA: hypothetical protein VKM55_04530 [Candidatus Lokiarchaeia archaeon]|nr:hypothetical protein [Candidatus Lokiarchaeia archaeon]
MATKKLDDPLKPIAAASTIHVTHHDGLIDFTQILVYDYVNISSDKTYYRRIKREPSFVAQEVTTIEENMQRYLDEEKNVVNGERVYPHVVRTSIDFKTEARFPVYTWIITFGGNESDSGTQNYEAITTPETLEYDVKSTYVFPANSRIVEIESSLVHENVLKHIVVFRGSKGDSIKPLERLCWILE